MSQVLEQQFFTNSDIGDTPRYQAISYLVGRLQKSDSKFTVLQSTHGEIPVSGMRGKLQRWLESHPDIDAGIWLCYPRTDRDGQINSVYVSALHRSALPEDYNAVQVSGELVWSGDGKLVIRVCRNIEPADRAMKQHPAWKPFLLTVQGFLSGAKAGEFWRLECDLDDRMVVLIDGKKLLAAPKKRQQKSKSANRQVSLEKPRKRKPKVEAA